jgi:hypothetical protein
MDKFNHTISKKKPVRKTTLFILVVINFSCCCCIGAGAQNGNESSGLNDHKIAILNQLRNEINVTYGFKNAVPRINIGPCGPFAKAFYEQWNAQFNDKVDIAFIMLKNSKPPVCAHILIKLPDGSYFDGGNGVVSDSVLLLQFPNSRIEVMKQFDVKLLENNAGGLSRQYPNCINYSNDLTKRIIEKYLTILSKGVSGNRSQ